MKAKERYDHIWNQITDKIQNVRTDCNIPFELMHRDSGDQYYVEDVNGGDNYFSVTPIRKNGREILGIVSYSVYPMICNIFYKTYEEFETALNKWLNEVTKE